MPRRAFVYVAAALAVVCSANTPVFAAAAPTWSGFYVGGVVGQGWANWSGDLTKYSGTTAAFDFPTGTYKSINGSGGLAGGQIGFAAQSNSVVWGIEGDISTASVKGSGVFTTQNFPFPPAPATQQVFDKHIQTSIDWLGTIRLRLGVLVQPTTLFYGTGGLAVAGTSSHQDVFFVPGNAAPALHASGSDAVTKWGWTVGLGVEHQLDSHWSLKAEYLYANLGKIDYRYVGTHTGYPYRNTPGSVHDSDGFSPTLSVQVARVGVVYKFGAGS